MQRIAQSPPQKAMGASRPVERGSLAAACRLLNGYRRTWTVAHGSIPCCRAGTGTGFAFLESFMKAKTA